MTLSKRRRRPWRPVSWILFGIGVVVALLLLAWPFYAPMLVRQLLAASIPDGWNVSFDNLQADFQTSRFTGVHLDTPYGLSLDQAQVLVSHPWQGGLPTLPLVTVELIGGTLTYQPVRTDNGEDEAGGWQRWLDIDLPAPDILPIAAVTISDTWVSIPDQMDGTINAAMTAEAGGEVTLAFDASETLPASGEAVILWDADKSLTGKLTLNQFEHPLGSAMVQVDALDLDLTIPEGNIAAADGRLAGHIGRIEMPHEPGDNITLRNLELAGSISNVDGNWALSLNGNEADPVAIRLTGQVPEGDDPVVPFDLTADAALAPFAPLLAGISKGQAKLGATGSYVVVDQAVSATWTLVAQDVVYQDRVTQGSASLGGALAMSGEGQTLSVNAGASLAAVLKADNSRMSARLNGPVELDIRQWLTTGAQALDRLDLTLEYKQPGAQTYGLGLAGDLAAEQGQYRFKGRLVPHMGEQALLPLETELSVVPHDDGVISLQSQSRMPAREGLPAIRLNGTYRPENGRFTLTLPKISLAITPDWFGRGPAKLPIAVQDWVGSAEGRLDIALSASGTTARQKADIALSGDFDAIEIFGLAGRDLSFSDEFSYDSGNGHAVSKTPAALSFTDLQVAEGYSLKNIATGWSWGGDHLSMMPLTADFLGADLVTTGFDVILDKPEFSTRLQLTGLKLGAFTDLLDVNGLSATGTMNGGVNVSYANNLLTLSDGSFVADGGALKYLAGLSEGQVAEQAALAFDVLENFQYDSLAMSLNGALGGEQTATLRLVGRNPAVYDGYPVDLNINLSGALDAIVQRSLDALSIPDRLEKQLRLQ